MHSMQARACEGGSTVISNILANGRPSVWANMQLSEGYQQHLGQIAAIEAKEERLKIRMRSLRSELEYLQGQPITLGGERRIKALKQELMEVGLELADTFEKHIKLDPSAARR